MNHPLTSHATGPERIAELEEQLRVAYIRYDLASILVDDLEVAIAELSQTK